MLHLLLHLLFFISITPPPSLASTTPQALLSPITKDSLTSLYTLSLNTSTSLISLLLDLSSPFSWLPCPPNPHPLLCNSSFCSTANSFPPPHCPHFPKPHNHPCICTVSPANPLTGECPFAPFFHPIILTNISLFTITNVHKPTTHSLTFPNFLSVCSPKDITGVAGLARSPTSLSSQFSSSLSIKNQFALCLPSSSIASGIAFFGAEPFHLLPPRSPELTTMLSYTPLLQHPMNPKDYYVDLHAIAVNGVTVQFLKRVLEFDPLGHGGVKLSTTKPYTTMRSHIYRQFIRAFAKATKSIRRARKVAPFELCFNVTALGVSRVGFGVPKIDLMLAGGKNWTVFGANSVKKVGRETACLAFIDGGPKAEQAVVIGGFQMEDNFLLFDLDKKRLGFSSSLLFSAISCGNFNFTSV
ncbi:hypothetical protein J5N97_013148 [Dioscorea zingiberensis]|uniref:Peptidase A1 domain-containing protein n=1 Tax=Dioscorea zingiberensis TaxID=325984 RepID=A0A9D5HIH6_9LILI|nr:hypothetical protein J5N97_013148 [Dioscorea zingiberensis]